MSEKISPTQEELLALCKAAWDQAPIVPDLGITFCTGGLFTTGLFQKATKLKYPVYAANLAIGCEGILHQFSPRKLAVYDDVFDSGATLREFFRTLDLYAQNAPPLYVHCYAPFQKTCFVPPVSQNIKFEIHTGKTLPADVWIHYFWEVNE